MSRTRKKLAIVAFAAMIGCTVRAPYSTPARVVTVPRLYATESTFMLTDDLSRRYALLYPDSPFENSQVSFAALMHRLETGSIDYFTSSHVPAKEDIWAAPLAVDGIAIIVHSGNRVASLTLTDLRDLYSGKLTNWQQLGGDDMSISPLTVSAETDVHREFQRMVMGNLAMTGNARLLPNYESMLQAVASGADTIGFLPYSRLDSRANAISFEGVAPNRDTIGEKLYPLRSTIFIIGREAPPPTYHNFIGWVQSEAGQAIVAESFAPLP